MAPSTRRNRMTMPERTRPTQRAGAEAGNGLGDDGHDGSPFGLSGGSDSRRMGDAETDRGSEIFRWRSLLSFSPCGRRWRVAPDEGFSPRIKTPHPSRCRFAPAIHLLPQGEKGRPARREGRKRYFPAFLPRGWLSRCRRSRCMRMWAASAEVLASAMARSKAVRASSLRPSCIRKAPRTPK
jgi:hypothetical protein